MPRAPNDNEAATKELVRRYQGEFTDYNWRSEKVDSQTYRVVCEVSLDGEKHDFIFKLNTEVDSCRYEGGTALNKLTAKQEEPWWQQVERLDEKRDSPYDNKP